MEPLIIQANAPAPVPALALVLKWIRPVTPRGSIFLGIRPIGGVGRDVRDSLLEYTDPQQAAAFVFGASPASTLSQEWRVVIVSGDTAHCYEINGGMMLMPTRPQSWRALKHRDLVWRYPRIGYTVDSTEEITKKGCHSCRRVRFEFADARIAIEISWPMKYSLYSENSQKFAYLLFEAIRQPNEPPTVSDIFSGLGKIPRPFRTLYYRCQAVVIVVLLSLRRRAEAAAKDAIGTPLVIAFQCGVWVRDVLMSCFILVLFALRVYSQLLFVLFLLACGRDLQKASQGLRNIADDMIRFDDHQRQAKDSNKLV
jgi:hypothetical protein